MIIEQEILQLSEMKLEDLKAKEESLIKGISYKKEVLYRLIKSVDNYDLLSYILCHYTLSGMCFNNDSIMDSKINYSRAIQINYIQSLIITNSSIKNIVKEDKDNYENTFNEIDNIFNEILEYSQLLVYVQAGLMRFYDEFNEGEIQFIVETQAFYLVQGSRYQHNELVVLEKLLEPHNDIFLKTFSITTDQIIADLKLIQYKLSQGKADKIMDFREHSFKGMNDPEYSRKNEDFMQKQYELFDNVFGLNNYIINDSSFWNNNLISALTKVETVPGDGTNDDLDKVSLYKPLPIVNYPFVNIGEEIYCLSYYNFFDNLYRNLRRIILEKDYDYLEEWNIKQSKSSEEIVAEIFAEILPNAKIYSNNIYRFGGKGMTAENDILVIIHDVLFVIEVKGSSIPLESPYDQPKSLLKSLEKLLEEADNQSQRFIKFLNENEEIKIYDNNGKCKATLKNENFQYIYPLSISIADINSVASKAEKIPFFKNKIQSVCLSIDDLLLYKDYFDSYFEFLHFFKYRFKALKISNLHVTDELDHLGLYIMHNDYHKYLENKEDKVFVNGYRELLDVYFDSLYVKDKNLIKPTQELPINISMLIQSCKKNEVENTHILINSILDLAQEQREGFNNLIEESISIQKDRKTMISLKHESELLFVIFIYMDGVRSISKEQKEMTYLHHLINCNKKEIVVVDIFNDFMGLEVKKIQLLQKDNLNLTELDIKKIEDYMDPILKKRKIINY